MFTKEHDKRDDPRVWLSPDETETLIKATNSNEREIAISLGVKCGLRSTEVLKVSPSHINDTEIMGSMLKIKDGIGEPTRQTPISQTLKALIKIVNEHREKSSNEPIVPVSTTQSLRNWVQDAAETVANETNNDEWLSLSFHDLRRTWATHLVSQNVDALVICDWGGWKNIETFLDHYKGQYSLDTQRRERDKVEWL